MTRSPSPPAETRVLVTGASGFIALHCILQLLEQGYRVRGTLRSPARAASLRAILARHLDAGVDLDERLELVTADLQQDEGWAEATRGCTFVLHVASPLPKESPKDENELIVPAREGALRVLRAASEAGVARVVMTSSIAAVLYGHPRDGSKVFDERDWSIPDGLAAYEKSKTLAERAAWQWLEESGSALELVTIQPGLVLGPILEKDSGTSGEAVRKLMARELPGCPRLGFAIVDVRDVASAHLAAMTTPEAAGERFCCCIEHVWMSEIAAVLKQHVGARGYRIPTWPLPDFAVRLAGLFDKTTRMIVPELGLRQDVSNDKIRRVLGWQPHGMRDAVESMADTMIEHGVARA